MDAPGYKEAVLAGYSLYVRAGIEKACYDKDGITLTVWNNGRAELSFIWGVLTVTTGIFNWPHPTWRNVFEKRLREAYAKAFGAAAGSASGGGNG